MSKFFDIDKRLKETWSHALDADLLCHDLTVSMMENSSNEFTKRLDSYVFFTQPLAISPLICSYFGWENIEINGNNNVDNSQSVSLLRCTECRNYLAIEFNHQLSFDSSTLLLKKYKRSLCTSHASSCSFRTKGERWIGYLDDQVAWSVDSDTSLWADDQTTIRARPTWPLHMEVPLYLIPLSPEYVLLQRTETDPVKNLRWKQLDIYEYLTKMSCMWSDQLELASKDPQTLNVSVLETNWKNLLSPKIVDFITSWWVSHQESLILDTQTKNPMEWFHAFMLKFSGHNKSFLRSDTKNGAELWTVVISILTIFGWRLCASSSHPEAQNKNLAFCPICRATVQVPRIVSKPFIDESAMEAICLKPISIQNRNIADNTIVAKKQLDVGQRKRSRSFDHYFKVKGCIKPSPSKRLKMMDTSIADRSDEEIWSTKLCAIRQSLSLKLRWSDDFHIVSSHRHFCPYASGFASEKMFPHKTMAAWEAILSSLFNWYSGDGEIEERSKRVHTIAHSVLQALKELS